MKSTTKQKTIVRKNLSKQGVVCLKELTKQGIVPSTLTRMVRTGEVIRVSHGVYRSSSIERSDLQKIAEVAKIIPKGIICLTSALYLHGVLEEAPPDIWVAIKKNSWIPNFNELPIRIIQCSEKYFSNYVETKLVNGIQVKTFGVAKSVVDCFRHRNKLGFEVARKSLESTISRKISYSGEVMEIARHNRVANVVRPYVQILVSNRSIG